MSQTVTAVQVPSVLGTYDGDTNYASYDFIVTSGVTVNEGDFVKFDSGGNAGNVTSSSVAADRIVGIAEGTTVGDGTKTVKVAVSHNNLYLVKANSALAATDVGTYFDLTGAAGAQQINKSGGGSATTGAFICLAVGPSTLIGGNLQGVNTSSYGVFKLIESAFLPLGS